MFSIEKKIEEEQFNKFLNQIKKGNIFQSPFMIKALQNQKKLKCESLFCINEKKEVVGVLISQKQKIIGISKLSVDRLVVLGGPLVLNENEKIIDLLLNKLKEKYRYNTLFIEIRNMFNTNKSLFERIGFSYEPHLEIIIDLEKDEEVLWSEVNTKRRNGIRRSLKEGCVFSEESSLDSLTECYRILTEVYQRARLPLHSFDFFYDLFINSSEKKGLKIFCVKHGNKIIGCMLTLVYGHTIYDYYAGAYSDYYNKYPNDLIPWEVFKWGKEKGYSEFCFGGAGKPDVPYGVREYKKKFGGDFYEFGRYYYYNYKFLYKTARFALKLYQRIRK